MPLRNWEGGHVMKLSRKTDLQNKTTDFHRDLEIRNDRSAVIFGFISAKQIFSFTGGKNYEKLFKKNCGVRYSVRYAGGIYDSAAGYGAG